MTVGQVTFKVLPLLLLFYMNYPPITCQNCGLPRILKVSDQLNESVDTGQTILAPIHAHNVVGVTLKDNPGNFAEVKYAPDTESTCGELSLIVGKPLWKPSAKMSFIDEHRLNEINVTLELKCSDGQTKDIQVIIPIRDENTAMPLFSFSKNEYKFTTEPCLLERCALIFDTDIFVTDQDIDSHNAKINVWTNAPKMINILHGFSNLEDWIEVDNNGGLKRKGFRTRVKLEYLPDVFKKSITFSIFANNTAKPIDSSKGIYIATTNVTINFAENPHRLLPPVFASPLYYAYVKNDGNQIYTRPANIYAKVPGDFDENTIEYEIEGEPDLISIDGDGKLSLIKDIGVMPLLINSTREYKVTAMRTPEVNASVPLILFLDSSCECDTTPGICPWPKPSTESPITLEPSIPTTELPFTTTEFPEYTTEKEDVSSTTTDPPTTPEDDDASSTITDSPTTPEDDDASSTITDPPTTPEDDDTSSKTTDPPTTPEDDDASSTTADPPTTPEDDDASSTTADPPTTSSSPLPTIPPDQCQCDCTEFICSDPQTDPSLNSTNYIFYPDPYSCTMYHRCPNSNEGPVDKLTFECPPETVFCPKMTACTTVEMCIERTNESWSVIRGGYGGGDEGEGGGSGEDECQKCQCRAGLQPDDPNNLCTSENHNQSIPDPKFCDVFHKCQECDIGNQIKYIDYPMRCPPGLKFCPSTDACTHHYECEEACDKSMMFQQCDVCKMGKWEGFDIFNKKFV